MYARISSTTGLTNLLLFDLLSSSFGATFSSSFKIGVSSSEVFSSPSSPLFFLLFSFEYILLFIFVLLLYFVSPFWKFPFGIFPFWQNGVSISLFWQNGVPNTGNFLLSPIVLFSSGIGLSWNMYAYSVVVSEALNLQTDTYPCSISSSMAASICFLPSRSMLVRPFIEKTKLSESPCTVTYTPLALIDIVLSLSIVLQIGE